jgi:regulation of enolase protein 1 (concanavalin A-like superfamily)
MVEPLPWRNEPPEWRAEGDTLTMKTGRETDFWNATFYGFVRHNGHFLPHPAEGDFSASVRFSAEWGALYDQAGLMVRVDVANWMKTGIEFTDGQAHFSVVVTRDGWSDWSVLALPEAGIAGIEVRVTRHAEALRVEFRLPEGDWRLARLCHLNMDDTVEVGPMACSPQGEGLEVRFSGFAIAPPIPRDLHG